MTGDPAEEAGRPRKKQAASPRNMAMNWLARREHSQAELCAKLAEREFSPAEINAAVASLVADGLVSDERFAEAFTAVRTRKGQGPVRIRMELKRRGVGDELIRMQLDEAGIDWRNIAADVRRKKFGAMMPADYKEKARQMRFLEYRGFTGDQIRSAVGDDFD
ncbi:MAG: regulatory protein RecX [Gammaproteobacteria bacterium]